MEKYLSADPADVDGDCTDDITELNDPSGMNPVNAAAPVGQAAVIISEHETFESLSYQRPGDDYYEQEEGRTELGTVSYLKFIIDGIETGHPRVYFMNISQGAHHRNFVNAAGLEWDELVRGEMVYQPDLVASDGSRGVYTFFLSPYAYQHSFDTMNRAHTLLAANMPLLNGNIALHLRNYELPYSQDLLPHYRSSRINLVYDQDIFAEIAFQALNTGNGYGLLRVADPDETPHPHDIVIYEALPNNLARVAGIISTEPQTPLSHVNLRAVQDGVPNAFIRGAVEDTDIAALIDSYVYYKVAENGWTLRAATPEEVAAHNANSRPSRVQTPERDLSVTSITALSSIAFEDWEAFGVKAANLAALKKLSYPSPVADFPNGFAVPFYFYDEFMKANGFYVDIEEMLADAEFQSDFAVQEAKLKKLRKKIKKGDTPDWIDTALVEMHATYPEGTSLRYRSSTNNEDLPGFNGAGLYDSKTQHPEETQEDGISKSLKQVYASLWNFEAFTQREFHNVDHLTTAMGVLVHPNFSDELANGVAVSFDPVYDKNGWYYVNTQVGEDLVTNPEAHSVPEEMLLHGSKPVQVLATSNLLPQGQMLLSETQRYQLRNHLQVIHDEFKKLYAPETGESFAMEIEFKITSANVLSIKQARPWVFYVAPPPSSNIPATGQPVINGTAQVGRALTSDVSGIADEDGVETVSHSYQWSRNDGSSGTDIPDAIESSYTLTPADALKTIKVRVTFIDDAGYEESVLSEATAQVPAIWAGAITVGNGPEGSGATGYSVFSSGMGSITTPDFELDGVTNTVQIVAQSQSGLHLGLSKELSNPLMLHVGSARFQSIDASIRKGDNSYIHTWGDSNLSWSVGDNLHVAILEVAANIAAAGVPTISGTAQVGATLTASTSGISDPDGLTNVSYSYQWIRDDGSSDTNIQDATGTSYTLVDADVGNAIKVKVSFADDAGNEESLTSAATEAATEPTDRPHGLTATVSENAITLTWQEPDNFYGPDYHILRHRPEEGELEPLVYVDFTGTDATTFTDTDVETGVLYVYQVRATIDMFATLGEPSDPIEARVPEREASDTQQASNTPATGAPSITGTVEVGETLISSTSGIADADGLTNVSYSYQWIRSEVSTDTDIPDATGTGYSLVDADEGKTIRVKVSFTDDAGHEETLTSAATAAVAARPNSPATGAPTITGTDQVGETLTASTSGIADPDGLTNVSYSYQWVRSDGSTDTDIPGANGSSYSLLEADKGKTIRVKVTFTDDTDAEESLLSSGVVVSPALPETQEPDAPGVPDVSPHDSTSLAVTWTEPVSDGGSAITGYKVQWKQAAGSWDTPADVSEATVTGTSHTITGLTGGTEYSVRVLAINDAGESPPSEDGSGTPRETVPPEVSGASVDEAVLTLTFSEALDENSEPPATAFTVTVSENVRAVDSVDVSGSAVTLTLASAATSQDTVTVSYTAPVSESAARLQDAVGNAAASFTGRSVANETPPPFTASVHDAPESHDGQSEFTFELRFSEEPGGGFSYQTLRDHAFTVTGGEVVRAQRLEPGKNVRWGITVRPDSSDAVTVVLPATTDCGAEGAICTGDGRMLAGPSTLTVAGPG